MNVESPPQDELHKNNTETSSAEKQFTLTRKLGTHWTGNNLTTILGWVTIASYNVEALDHGIHYGRLMIRRNTLLAMLLSTGSGGISITNFNGLSNSYLQMIFNILFTTMSFLAAACSAYIKVYQIQERYEQFIKAKQEWTTFITQISTQLQLPIQLRVDALDIINEHKNTYIRLLNMDYELPIRVKEDIKRKMKQRKLKDEYHMSLIRNNGLSIYDVTFDIATNEGETLRQAQKYSNYTHNKEINVIYDEICNQVNKDLESHKIQQFDILHTNTMFGLFGHLIDINKNMLKSIRNIVVF